MSENKVIYEIQAIFPQLKSQGLSKLYNIFHSKKRDLLKGNDNQIRKKRRTTLQLVLKITPLFKIPSKKSSSYSKKKKIGKSRLLIKKRCLLVPEMVPTLNGCSVRDDDPVVVRHRPVELSVYYVVVVHSLRFEETSLEWYVVLVSAAGDLGALELQSRTLH